MLKYTRNIGLTSAQKNQPWKENARMAMPKVALRDEPRDEPKANNPKQLLLPEE